VTITPAVTSEPRYFLIADLLDVEDSSGERLSLDIPIETIGEETGGLAITATVYRTGDTTAAQQVLLLNVDPTHLSIPASVTIPAGADSKDFSIHVINDPLIDGTQTAAIVAYVADHSLASGRDQFEVTDDDAPGDLTIGGRLHGSLPSGSFTVLTDISVIDDTALSIAPGTSLLFEQGTGMSVSGQLLAQGLEGNPIRLTSSAATPTPGSWDGVWMRNGGSPQSELDFVEIAYATTGLRVSSPDRPQVILSNADVHHNQNSGISLSGWPDESIYGVDIFDSRIHHNGTYGISVTAYADGGYGGSGVIPNIIGNEIFENDGDGLWLYAEYDPDPWVSWNYNALVRPTVTSNIIRDNGGAGIATEAYDPEDYPGYVRVEGDFSNNLVMRNAGGGFAFTQYGDGRLEPAIANNTVVNNLGAGILHGTLAAYSDVFIRNKVVSGNTTGIEATGNQAFLPEAGQVGFNDVWNNSGGDWLNYPVGFGDLTTTNANGTPADFEMNISVDPLFAAADDYHLLSASPAVDAGTGAGAPATDFEGDPRDALPDIGYDESVPRVVARLVFYNDSAFDDGAEANAADDGAIAPGPAEAASPELGKTALLPGQTASFQNVTSYEKGLNGVIVDIAGLAGTPTAADFQFKMGNDDDPTGWADAPTPTSITVRPGDGVGGSDRVTLVWPNYTPPNPDPTTQAVAGQWLEVTVLPTSNTGLTEPVLFYFGNALGDSGTGNTSEYALVSAIDFGAVRDNPHSPNNPAAIDDFADYNRDTLVNAIDFGLVRDNPASPNNALKFISVPAASAPEEPGGVQPSALYDAALEDSEVDLAPQVDINWLSGLDDLSTTERSSRPGDPAREAVERLLATW